VLDDLRPLGTVSTRRTSGWPANTSFVPSNTSTSIAVSGHAARIDRTSGEASSTSPIRRVTIRSTLAGVGGGARPLVFWR
jgi:hypothetical protein